MKSRRQFITLLGGAAAAWPVAARGQQAVRPAIGFIHVGSPGPFIPLVAEFRKSLGDAGFVEGRSVAIEYRWADDQYDRLPMLATDLVRRQVSAIIAWGPPAARAVKAATTTVPVVFLTGGDPVAEGLVDSLNRPSGNLTGVSFLVNTLVAKRLEVLRELVPKATLIAALVNPHSPTAAADIDEMLTAARLLKLQLRVLRVSTEADLDDAFASLVQAGTDGLLIGPDPFFTNRRDKLVALSTRHAVPTIYFLRESAEAGGLVSYGTSLVEAYRQIGAYTSKILKGVRPTDLPVLQPTRFELVINLKTAKALGITVPTSILLRADEVIE
jgi:putative ABC transport system substrate-binding protein